MSDDELKPISKEEEKVALDRKVAVQLLWNRGNLDYKLDELQRDMKQKFYNSKRKVNVWLTSRRLGKSTLLCVLAIEMCIKRSGTIVKFLSPEMKQTKTIIGPLINEIIQDAPDNLKPGFRLQEMVWRFPNGSEIHLAGSDGGGSEKLRGCKAHLCIVDEAGFCENLKYAVRTILLPTMLTTGGKMILSSTPPKEANHEFLEFVEDADSQGILIKKTVYDCPRYTPEFIEKEIIANYPGGRANIEFRREYLSEILRDEDYSVIPEFTDELEAKIVREWERPAHFDSYVAIDYGVRDLTVALFAYYDFKQARVIIEDEIVMNGAKMNTASLAKAIQDKELELWHDRFTGEPIKPYLRVSDNNLLLIQDLQYQHGMTFLPTDKHNKEGFLNQLRLMIQDEKVIINPKCKTLISHLKFARWDKDKKKIKRSKEVAHADALDAAIYLIRNMVYSKNPYPLNTYNFDTFVRPEVLKEKKVSEQARVIKNIFSNKVKTRF
jgi:hypothetical protein